MHVGETVEMTVTKKLTYDNDLYDRDLLPGDELC